MSINLQDLENWKKKETQDVEIYKKSLKNIRFQFEEFNKEYNECMQNNMNACVRARDKGMIFINKYKLGFGLGYIKSFSKKNWLIIKQLHFDVMNMSSKIYQMLINIADVFFKIERKKILQIRNIDNMM